MGINFGIVYGFGFYINSITNKMLFDFIKNHNVFCESEKEIKLFAEVSTEYDLRAYFEDYPCDNSGHEGFGAVISNIISRETGIRVGYEMGQYACHSFPAVLLTKCMPWELNEKEKALTQEALTALLVSYAEELGLEKSDVGFVEIEYYG